MKRRTKKKKMKDPVGIPDEGGKRGGGKKQCIHR
jgi:hypothetical protein